MLILMNLLVKTLDQVEKAGEQAVEDVFTARGCSSNRLQERLELARQLNKQTQEMLNERDRRAEEAWKAKVSQRAAEEASASSTGTHRYRWCPSHRKA